MDSAFAYGYSVPEGAPLRDLGYSYTGLARLPWGRQVRRAWRAEWAALLRLVGLVGWHVVAWGHDRATGAVEQTLLLECRADDGRVRVQQALRAGVALIGAALHIFGNRNHF